jgi:hypothetical protein
MAISKLFNSYLSDEGVVRDGLADRSWYTESIERSRRIVELAKDDLERLRIDRREGYGDHFAA